MRLDLVDEYRLIVYPIVLGEGQKLFVDSIAAKLQLVKSEVFSSGAIALTYQTAPKEVRDPSPRAAAPTLP